MESRSQLDNKLKSTDKPDHFEGQQTLKGPTNIIFLRDLSLDFHQQHTNLVDHCLKPVFVKHFCSWMKPIPLNVHSKSPAFQAKHLKDPDQQLSGDVDTKQLAWKRAPIRSYFGSSSKAATCLQINDKVFWNSIGNHNRSCERYIGLMSLCLSEGRVKDFREAEEKRQVDTRIRGFICHGSKDENE